MIVRLVHKDRQKDKNDILKLSLVYQQRQIIQL